MSPKHAAPGRLDELTSWHADWSGLRVAVLGLGATGFSVADTLTELGADVLVVAETASEEHAKLIPVIGARLVVGDLQHPPTELIEHDPELIVASPGFAPHHPLIKWAAAESIPLWGDIELAWRVRDKVGTPAEWILITGTNGKTTTVQLTATLIAAAGHRVAPCGNIGVPVLDAVRDPQGFDVFVVELSSHQLHYLALTEAPVTPHSAVCLNIARDHLEWHGSFEAYRKAKSRVYENTRVACVYNKADAATRTMVENADVIEGARAIGFDLGVPGPSDLGIVDGILCDRAFLDDRRSSALEIITLDDLRTRGLDAPHVVANILAASALARAYGIAPEVIRVALHGFSLDAHRIQLIVELGGIRWINDSKATNPHAADASLSAFDSVVWVLGGLLKGVDVDPLVERHASRLRGAVIIGTEQDVIAAALQRHAPHIPVFRVDPTETDSVMVRAVDAAREMAEAGDVVLLAPAAASLDQFTGYDERGALFAKAVNEIQGGGANDQREKPHRRED
ncbi:UDP-N-acetylmuramoyl-L-alanine--D-glutamate ligase [Paramicrobacterium agarici]|uniref:UDP-N-acetylmuramoylalanine--D-glutamate ligase n=1 Tax=Paramicrobacterium agarici TaxID=630514 RepID=A0A2A9DXZ2_9MICO|nr:UDP-N-acetylmuramoyl-L-alanine--D-glutamate ligase [Microbacterium agarici]PFG31453.1 UDP-N-acetylmuramoylalanine--D-glutamate ligase [Microbacterium agarici]